MTTAPAPPAPTRTPLRRLIRPTLVLLVLGMAVYVLLPQVDQVERTLQSLHRANWVFVIPGVLFAAVSFVGAALSLQGATSCPLPLIRTTEANVAAAFLGRIAPANLGSLGVTGAYLHRVGASVPQTTAAIGLDALAGIVVHLLMLVITGLFVGQFPHPKLSLPTHFPIIVGVVVVLVVAGIALAVWSYRRRRDIWSATLQRLLLGLRAGRTELLGALRDPQRGVRLMGGSLLITVAQIGALSVSVSAFGGDTDSVTIAFVYLASAAVAAAAPTPGGLGALEAALVSGLTLFGVAGGPAVAGVLLYRLLTFWLPILPGAVAVRHLRRLRLL